jgi:RNA polymerase sigma factor (sigma-70 family)
MVQHTDEQLIAQCVAGQHAAFEILVRRYQTLVCSIAYSILGDVATSEDVGQEVLLIAWKRLGELRDPSRLKAWLATITRNQARGWLRRQTNTMQELTSPHQVPQPHSPQQDAARQEELQFVWQTLQQLPATYREPLVLYYRQEQSVGDVAAALDLSPSAVKQRLARGRNLLREEVTAAVERTLRKSVPGTAFTLAVMSVVAGATQTAAATAIATGTAATAAAKSTGAVTLAKAAAAGSAGAVAGGLFGLLGGFLGALASWYRAEFTSQRTMIVRQSIGYSIGLAVFCSPFLAMQWGWQPWETLGAKGYGISYALWMLLFFTLNGCWIWYVICGYRQLEKRERDAKTEPLPTYQAAPKFARQWEGRRWQTRTQFLGLPLVHVAFSDPDSGADHARAQQQGTARGWIAVGERAFGRVLAIGNIAVAPIALGTMACGFVSVGIVTAGVLSIGIVAVAVFAGGIAAIGGVASGMMAIGVFAVGPLALGLVAAKGALAIAWMVAEGSLAIAKQANNPAAADYLQSSVAIAGALRFMHWLTQLGTTGKGYLFGLIVLPLIAMWPVAYRRREISDAGEVSNSK